MAFPLSNKKIHSSLINYSYSQKETSNIYSRSLPMNHILYKYYRIFFKRLQRKLPDPKILSCTYPLYVGPYHKYV